jgi:AcrR family transcriptional regulator
VGRREDNKAKKRERLEAEGLRLFLELGYDRCSIELIVAASDVARGTFYLYFPDKLALFEALIDRWFAPLIATLGEADARLEAAGTRADSLMVYLGMAQSLVVLGTQHRDEVLISFREIRSASDAGERLRTREKQLIEVATALTEHGVARGLINAEDPRLTTLVILGASERLHYEWLIGGDLGDPTVLGARIVRMFSKTLGLPDF